MSPSVLTVCHIVLLVFAAFNLVLSNDLGYILHTAVATCLTIYYIVHALQSTSAEIRPSLGSVMTIVSNISIRTRTSHKHIRAIAHVQMNYRTHVSSAALPSLVIFCQRKKKSFQQSMKQACNNSLSLIQEITFELVHLVRVLDDMMHYTTLLHRIYCLSALLAA